MWRFVFQAREWKNKSLFFVINADGGNSQNRFEVSRAYKSN